MTANILHIVLSLSVLLSTTGLALSQHFCQHELQSVSIFTKAKSCHSKKTACQHSKHRCDAHASEDCNGCCSDAVQYFQSDHDQQVQSFEFKELKSPVLLSAVFIVFNIPLPCAEQAEDGYLTYKPPIVCKDIPVLLQTFLC